MHLPGDRPRRGLVRATGPALATFGVEHVFVNSRLRIPDAAGRIVAENNDWRDDSVAAGIAHVEVYEVNPVRDRHEAACYGSFPAAASPARTPRRTGNVAPS